MEEPKILSFEEKTQMLDELYGEISEERRSEILVTLKQDVGYMHTALDAKGEKIQKLEQVNADIKATNQMLYNQQPPTYVSSKAQEEKKVSEREEKISNINLNDLNNF